VGQESGEEVGGYGTTNNTKELRVRKHHRLGQKSRQISLLQRQLLPKLGCSQLDRWIEKIESETDTQTHTLRLVD
jgi:hypothetical protein